jgi:hypothetical protein
MMKKLLAFSALCALTVAFGLLAFGPSAFAGPVKAEGDVPYLAVPVELDCYAIGESLAQQEGGELAKAVLVTQDGQAVCRIVILLPASDGEAPKRKEVFTSQ